MKKKFMDTPLLIAIGGLIIYLIPFILSGEDSVFLIHDNLDSSFVYHVILDQEKSTFNLNPEKKIDRMMGEMPRMAYPTVFSIKSIIFALFNPFSAYLLNFLFVHILAFAGMYLLLRSHLLIEEENRWIVAFTSFCFSIIPFYSIYGISCAGTPLLLYAFLNLKKLRRIYFSYFLIVLFCLYSSLVLTGVFAIILLTAYLLINLYKHRKFYRKFAAGTGLMIGVYSVASYQLIYQFFFKSGFVSHRSEFIIERWDFETMINNASDFFWDLQYHASSPLGFILVPALFSVIIGTITKHKLTSSIITLFIANVVIAFIYGLFNWEGLEFLRKAFPIFNTFQWNRFYFLSPLIWLIQLAFALTIIKDSLSGINSKFALLVFICCAQVFYIWRSNTELRETSYNLLSNEKVGWTYRQFFAEDIFSEIKTYINKPLNSYRVASIGMHPAVALYNGMYTIDGYLPSYPLGYKRDFNKIITSEIEKAEHLKLYFNEWGSRCYLLANELSHNFTVDKQSGLVLKDLRYDFTEGPKVDYILSAVQIENPEMIKLQFLRSFETAQSKWKIFLYQVQDERSFNSSMSTTVIVKVQARMHDMFQLFFVPDGESNYSEENSIRMTVNGKETIQTVRFQLPESVKEIGRLRLDVGRNPDQKTLLIESILIKKRDNERLVIMESLSYNHFITNIGSSYNLQIIEGKFNPYFEFDPQSIQSINHLLQLSSTTPNKQ